MRCSRRFVGTSIYMGLPANLVQGCDGFEGDRTVFSIPVFGSTSVYIFHLHAHGKVSVTAGHDPTHGEAQSKTLARLDRR